MVPELELSDREQYADWLESTLLARNSHLGHDAIAKAGQVDAGLSDAQVSLALKVMQNRQRFLPGLYPFKVSEVAVQVVPGMRSSVYGLLLHMSPYSPARQLAFRSPSQEMAQIFEKIVVVAMQGLLGPKSKAIRFGWPSDEGRPAEFYQAIEWLAAKMGVPPGRAFRPPLRKDGGVDVVAWRSFSDGKSGFPVALVQCTLQQELVSKSKDIDVRNWAGWLTLDVDPTTVLAVPGTLSKKEDWDEIALRALILDRIRIVSLVENMTIGDIDGASRFVDDCENVLSDRLAGA